MGWTWAPEPPVVTVLCIWMFGAFIQGLLFVSTVCLASQRLQGLRAPKWQNLVSSAVEGGQQSSPSSPFVDVYGLRWRFQACSVAPRQSRQSPGGQAPKPELQTWQSATCLPTIQQPDNCSINPRISLTNLMKWSAKRPCFFVLSCASDSTRTLREMHVALCCKRRMFGQAPVN